MSTVNTAAVVHIDETLSDRQLQHLERCMAETAGVLASCVHEKARHLMVVDYDAESTDAGSILHTLSTQGLHAELIGGI